MIGIYKITNKINGKSYVGQSIHCGKRLDEHCKGSQLIDEIIQIEGIENFNFEILKEVEKEKLSYWEDYYIMKYKTMFPNGYNKRWNCKEEIRKKIKQETNNKEIENSILKDNYILFPIDNIILKKMKYSDYIYAWLLLHSCNIKNKNYNLIYKKDFTLKQIAQDTHRHRDTISKHFKELIKEKLILETEYNQKKAYKIPYSNDYIELNKDTVLKLLSSPQEELIKTYAYLLKQKQLKENNISTNEIILAFGHSNGNPQIFNRFKLILNTLKELNT